MSGEAKNILFIMFDQLRYDYLSCYGHPHLHTPHFDRIAEMGMRFTNCYVQSPICGSSRMSFYTGRYVDSHGASWNGVPLRVGEQTIGDLLKPRGMTSWLVGKTHMRRDKAGMARLGLDPNSFIGARVAECGFELFERDDGLWPEGPDGFYDPGSSSYNEHLQSLGYDSDNPWMNYANAGITDEGDIASGWFMQNASQAANIREEDSETPYMTSRCIEFIDMQNEAGNSPWFCHLSYIKPHWPYIVPAPYHNLYSQEHILPVNRSDAELSNPHPVYAEFMNNAVGKAFSRDEVRNAVIPAYMGLIKQADDQLGRLFQHLEDTGRMADTMIVITSDHGDYLGDHWLGEKNLFHHASVKAPLIIYDPSSKADSTRGHVCDDLVESIDLAATFANLSGATIEGELDHILEGRSLLPVLHGSPTKPRKFAISEYDYSMTSACKDLGVPPKDARLFMVANHRWKYIDAAQGGFRPLLFDLKNDPQELYDCGESEDPEHQAARKEMAGYLNQWFRRLSQRTTLSDNQLLAMAGASGRKGIVLGLYDGTEVDKQLVEKFTGKAKQRHTPPRHARDKGKK